ncbi:M14 family metallopeptidase [Pseudozobellia thermophila]|uniref:Zinc carboxypeptidase n=1 Tax=Pseudozobellia thermophila TaxID=192903 RepID=A0A1M6HT49_9FLAO|nr:M14 family metallopeptidase [Pseudozobellia thermophila]SHJ25371.1 Zinc carboxypeptidase [Pseudozobellia thermophila]
MRALLLVFTLAVLQNLPAQEAVGLAYYLPDNTTYDPRTPTPGQVIGHEIGEWHITHDKLVFYMRSLAKASNRIHLANRGETAEGRPLLLLTITSEKNHQNIDQIRSDHLALSEGDGTSKNVANMPIVVYQGFSIHGNEPSGSNAALAYAYYLAAAQGPEIEKLLDEVVILLDPSLNPDGLQRFAHWANTHKGILRNPDSNDREYHEVWPGGRTNHYWFDMNRDWLPAQLPESRARIETFHSWMPNILTDHHEMGTNSTFFFQPGIPSRVHPLTPKANQVLTAEIGSYHAEAFDKIGSLYFSEEQYDDYYYGKGSTFPDINGGIGILFEQASSRGHAQESENGLLTFPFTIKNQMVAALSTLKAAEGMRVKILKYQQRFFEEVGLESAIGRTKAIVFGDPKDAARTWHLAEILYRHKIKLYEPKADFKYNGKDYKKGYSYIVPLGQKNHRLIKAMFEKRTSFTDSIFYDISAWTFPLAFNMDYSELRSLHYLGNELAELDPPQGSIDNPSTYAYLFEWNGYYAPKALNMILERNLRVKVAKDRFTVEGHSYGYGTLMIPVQNQVHPPEEIHRLLKTVARECKIHIKAVETGLAKGIDLGSSDFDPVKRQKTALLVGKGTRPYDAGEIWHLFDTRYHMKLTKLDLAYLESVDLGKYTDIIVPSINPRALTKAGINKLKNWVKAGGTLIGYRSATEVFTRNGLIDLKLRKDSLVAKNVSFGEKNDFKGAQQTGGAIFEAKIDLSHPINFGYSHELLPLFRNTNIYIEPHANSYNNPIQYTSNALLSGYISEENLKMLNNSVPFQVQGLGKGRVMVFTDNTNFRAFWYGTNKLLMNAIFFGEMM